MKINCCSFCWCDHVATNSQKQLSDKVVQDRFREKAFRRIKRSYPISEQSSLLSHVKRIINHLETLLDGCYLGELSPRTLDLF
jgi:aspartokinase/homoserine dehydrogenase 1